MRIGLQIPSFTWPGAAALAPTLAKIVTTAEDAGFYSVWVMDHFFQIEIVGPAELEMMESYSTLSYIAALTKRVRLGALVTGVIYRYPGLLVKTVNTLDVLSGGRAYMGIGAAWFEREAKGLGVPFPPLAERFGRLEEALQIAHQMWSEDNGAFVGQYYQLAETLSVPQPLEAASPIMIGGMGEQKTLRMVAQYADACNLFARAGAAVIQQKLDVLKGHCDALGRDYETIERTGLTTVHLAPGQMSAGDVIALCRELAGVGIQHLILNMPNVSEIAPLETFGREIIPAVAEFSHKQD